VDPHIQPFGFPGSYISTSQPLATAWVDFEGSEVTAVFATAPSYGIAKITLDPGTVDEQVDMVDLYSPSVVWQVDSLYTKSGLANTAHTLVVECMGLTNSSSTGCAVVLDALEITGTLAQAPAVTKVDDKDYDDCAYFPEYSGGGVVRLSLVQMGLQRVLGCL